MKEILAKADNLPPLPGVAQKIMATMQDPEFTFRDLAEFVKFDPGITAHVLRMSNSPLLGAKREISSLEQALAFLGANRVVEIVLSAEMVKYYKIDQDGYRLTRGELWRHSMATALLAQKIGENLKYDDISSLFTAALLHDVGKLIISQFVEEEFSEIERRVREESQSFVEAERAVLGIDHGVLGGVAARQWNFPEAIVTAIAFHHAPEKASKHRKLTAMVALANLLCVAMGVGGGADGLAAPCPPSLLKMVGLERNDLDLLTLEVKDILDKAEDFLNLAQG